MQTLEVHSTVVKQIEEIVVEERDGNCTCEFCGNRFDFRREGDQVVLRVEQGQDWNGDLAFACGECERKYKAGEILQTLETKGSRVGDWDRAQLLSEIWEVSEGSQDPLFGVFLLGKPKKGEGARWVETDKQRELNKRLRAEFEAAFEKRNGISYKEWSKQKQKETLIRARQMFKDGRVKINMKDL
jgi:hypothetical protein